MKLKLQSDIPVIKRYGVEIRQTQMPHPIAQFAMHLIERWGMVAAQPDGEDSAGRSKLRLATPEEIVSRANQTALIAFEQFAHKDWLLDVPNPSDEELKGAEAF